MPPLPPLPPISLVLPTLSTLVLPAAGGAALVMCLFLVLGRWAAALGSAVAVVVAFGWANYTFAALAWQNTGRYIPWKIEEPITAWHYLPRAALVLLIVGLVSRWLGLLATHFLTKPGDNNPAAETIVRYWWLVNLVTWLPRIVAVAVTSGSLVSPQAAEFGEWVRPALAVTMLFSWMILDGIARAGAGCQVAAYQSVIFFGAGTVLIYSGSERFMDIALILSFAMFGIAVAAGVGKADSSGAVPAGIAFLPGLMLNGRILLDSLHKVPLISYWLIALAPLMLAPFVIPSLNRKTGWTVCIIRAVLVLTPVVIAVFITAQHEKLDYPGEW